MDGVRAVLFTAQMDDSLVVFFLRCGVQTKSFHPCLHWTMPILSMDRGPPSVEILFVQTGNIPVFPCEHNPAPHEKTSRYLQILCESQVLVQNQDGTIHRIRMADFHPVRATTDPISHHVLLSIPHLLYTILTTTSIVTAPSTTVGHYRQYPDS